MLLMVFPVALRFYDGASLHLMQIWHQQKTMMTYIIR